MRRFWLLIVAVAMLSACTDSDGAKRALEQAGYREIRMGGYAPFACSDKDTFATKFTAIGPTGVPVKGAVCSGFMKGKTIRLD